MQSIPDAADLRRFAVAASCDPRTIVRVLRGERVRGLPGHRIRRVLREAGLLPPATKGAEPAAPAGEGRLT